MTDFKQSIIDALDTMRRRDVAEKQHFKARAYARVIAQLANLPHITSYDDVKDISGIGDKIKEKIEEILITGSLRSAERVKESYHLDTVDVLIACYGIGPAKAKSLMDVHGIRTISDLRALVIKTPGILNDNQRAGLTYYDDLLQRIPRTEMLEHDALLRTHVCVTSEIVGSFRREAETSGDIDMLLCSDRPESLTNTVSALQSIGYIKVILALGDKKCMAIVQMDGMPARRLDILLTPPAEYAYAILYFTGSDKFNVAFRQHALDKGYTLNEHALTALSLPPPPPMKTEQDIFKFLGLLYTAPKDRVGATAVTVRPPVRKIKIIKP